MKTLSAVILLSMGLNAQAAKLQCPSELVNRIQAVKSDTSIHACVSLDLFSMRFNHDIRRISMNELDSAETYCRGLVSAKDSCGRAESNRRKRGPATDPNKDRMLGTEFNLKQVKH